MKNRVKFITPGEAVALTLAAQYGPDLKKELKKDFKQSKNPLVKEIGEHLIGVKHSRNQKIILSAKLLQNKK
jgi:hypothetical protein